MGHVFERPIPVVSKEHVGAVVVDVKILMAVVVIVAHGHAQTIARIGHARCSADIRECPLPVIAIQRIAGP